MLMCDVAGGQKVLSNQTISWPCETQVTHAASAAAAPAPGHRSLQGSLAAAGVMGATAAAASRRKANRSKATMAVKVNSSEEPWL